jgi:putative autoinducer-2 (AI-2) aldolase
VPEADTIKADNFRGHLPAAPTSGSQVKGADGLGWGMRNRLARIFPRAGRTVMLAFDHGYFQGPTSGLERIDLDIVPLARLADTLMCTRGALRSSIPPSTLAPTILRASGGPSILGSLSDERVALDIEDAVRLNASGVAVQVFIGSEHEAQTVNNMTRLVDLGERYGVPVMGVTAVGRELTRDARYLRLACRIIAELGAHVVKTYYCEDGFETVTASCPVPVVMAGGKKIPEEAALTMVHRAMCAGAAGVDMGRNIFQSEHPAAMLEAVRAIVHDDATPADAYELYRASAAKSEP